MMSVIPLETCLAFSERWNNEFCYKVALCWLFLLNHTAMHGSMNIKFKTKMEIVGNDKSSRYVRIRNLGCESKR